MQKTIARLTVLSVFFLLGSIILFFPGANVAECKEKITMSTATPMYPAFAEQIGINLYINAIIGMTETHPDLKNTNSKSLTKECFTAIRVRHLKRWPTERFK